MSENPVNCGSRVRTTMTGPQSEDDDEPLIARLATRHSVSADAALTVLRTLRSAERHHELHDLVGAAPKGRDKVPCGINSLAY